MFQLFLHVCFKYALSILEVYFEYTSSILPLKYTASILPLKYTLSILFRWPKVVYFKYTSVSILKVYFKY